MQQGAWSSAKRISSRRFRDEKCSSRDVERRSSSSFGRGEEKRSSEGRRKSRGQPDARLADRASGGAGGWRWRDGVVDGAWLCW